MEPPRADSSLPYLKRQMCAERFCNRPASLAADSSCGTARFCYRKHRNKVLQRELTRLDRLLNKIFLLEAKWLNLLRTYAAGRSTTGMLVLFQRNFERPLAEQHTFPDMVPPRLEEVGYCFNGCVHAMEILAGVLAFFAEGSFCLEEADILHVKADSSVLVIEHDEEHSTIDYVAERHMMHKVSSCLGDFYLDPTAPQYGRAQGLQECAGYLQTYSDRRHQHGPCSTVFGNRYTATHARMDSSDRGSDDRYYCMETLISTRSINNAVYEKVRRAGGRNVLGEMGDADWKKIELEILNSVDSKLRKVREDLDKVWYDVPEHVWDDFYEDIMYASQGIGNEAIIEALGRMHGRELQS